MTDFTGAAVRLAGFAGAHLGWSPDAFWRATPAELAAVVRALAGAGRGGSAARRGDDGAVAGGISRWMT